jgi:phospholipid/cholesterol/gamma-HCH transport system permease protein
MLSFVARVGSRGVVALTGFGRFWRFVAQTWFWMWTGWWRARNVSLLFPQCYEIGYRSVPVILITGAFVGMVLAVQTVEQFRHVGLADRMGLIINLSVVRELGPVLAAVMLAGRVGGALTAELGTMNVTEQLDALRSMGVDPVRHLVVPRFLACLFMTPFLTMYTCIMGAAGGWFICTQIFGVASAPYWNYSAAAVEWWDLFNGIVKSFLFGGAIGLISCFKGFTCKPGAEGVGRACTEGFVANFITILALDFFTAYLLMGIYRVLYGFRPVPF